MKRIYVAGPITLGDKIANVRRAIDVGQKLLELGYAPFVPHLSVFWELLHQNTHEAWMDIDLSWLKVADAVIRLPGQSIGADMEVARAISLGIPVYEGLTSFLNTESREVST